MRACLGIALGLVIVLVCPAAANAQNSGPPVQTRAAPDFLFGRPDGAIGVRGGWTFARAGSDWYDFITGPNQFTIDRSDFNGPGIAADVSFGLSSRASIVGSVEFSRASVDSEYRQLVDNNRQPITQTTQLGQVNVTASVKYALTDRGRQVGNFAYVPRGVIPYVGAGGGMLWYKLRQVGDFVDMSDPVLPVFSDVLESKAWTPALHAFGGVDVRVLRRLYVTVDVRYLWAAGDMKQPFLGFEALDLSGLRTSAGINFLF